MRLSPLLAALLLTVSTTALAQPAPPAAEPAGFDDRLAALVTPGGLTADRVAARAATASPIVARRRAERAERQTEVRAARIARVPRVQLSASYTRLSEVDTPELAPGFALPSYLDSFGNRAELAVPLSDYLLRDRHQIAAAERGVDAARLAERGAALAAAADARVAYYEWIRAQLQVVVAAQSIAQVEATLQQITALAAAERASRADVLRIAAQAAETRQTWLALRNLANLRERQLRLAIDAGPDEALAVGEDVGAELAVAGPGDPDPLLTEAMRRRLEVRTLDAALDASARGRRAVGAGRLPRLEGFASASYDNPSPRIVPAQDAFALTWSAGLRLTWSLPEALATGPQRDRRAAQDAQLRADRAGLRHRLELELVAASGDVALAGGALATSADGLAAAEESYRVRQALLAADRATAVELVDAESELTRARFASIDARIDLRIALTRLAHAAGSDAPSPD